MRWSNVFVIVRREVRDQIRDRRTLFMVFILPVLLYPILAIGLLKLQSEFEQKARKVVVVGKENLPPAPPLLNEKNNRFAPSLFDSRDEAELMTVEVRPADGAWADPGQRQELITRTIRLGDADAVVFIPHDVRQKLDRLKEEEIPVFYESTHEQSQTTYLRVKEVLSRWREFIVEARVSERKLPTSFTEPIEVKGQDVAPQEEQGGNVWARLFPFLIVMMSLTGAFYPAIDLCAGEKERGTMETLLISPASRGEIVMGKFLTVVLASMTTALLNILSMGLTGVQMAKQLGAMSAAGARATETVLSPPSLASVFWMVLLLVPLSVFFSALCVALAVLAKSMKEGQYYMTPLYLVCLPLVFLTLAPGIELNLFYSLVPVTGVSLLLRSLMLREYDVAWRYFIPVLLPTIVYGGVALRWAVDQFHREEVLFREAERFDLRLWARHLLRDKEPTPTAGQAIFCFAMMLTLAWFLLQYLAMNGLATSLGAMAAGQIAFILTPPLSMALFLTSSPRRTLRLNLPRGSYVALALGLVFALNPLVNELGDVVTRLFPMTRAIRAAMEQMVGSVPSLGVAVLLFAFVPAICEEFAFRGFILSGLEHGHRERSAIVLSALLFAFLHVLLSLFQQFFNAAILGVILGLLAVRSRSILPGIVFHFVNNAMAVALPYWKETPAGARIAEWIYRDPAKGLYHGWLVILSVLVSAALLAYLWRSRPAGKAAANGERLVSEPLVTAG
ncbi:MAG: ABC transporter permease subunit [Isosphaeraceae bacterium]|nr:ABC transporter permease subunit [Isosphaeraceae bacterium]